ncbi:DNA polymerase Y family protein [Desulfogranum japonicum]|uniref:DNA polymerase Y family protein n=1 Tax=Desulfogranum japonicum TaxID=231447 RepID=UPI00040A648D|nr:hypothetical protein [Desulfogranum japonicum]
MERKIIHLNIADFSVAVERLLDSSLQSSALIIAAPTPRSTVYDMSEEAYQDGVRKGMMLYQARKRCRQAIVLPPRPEQYQKILGRCLEHARQFSPRIEPSQGNGHIYLDVTGTHRLFGPPPDIGWRLRNILRQDLGLDPIWSVAPNKLTAKVASRLVKPVGEYIVAAGEEDTFLAPLDLHLLPGIMPHELFQLRSIHMYKVYQALHLSAHELGLLFGTRAHSLYQLLRGIDLSPVSSNSPATTRQRYVHVFNQDTNHEPLVRSVVAYMSAQGAHDLRERGLGCLQVGIQLTYSDSIQVTRQATANSPATDNYAMEQLALTALYRCWRRRVRLRRIELYCSRLRQPVQQLSLFSDKGKIQQHTRNHAISKALDSIQGKYGSLTVQRGICLHPSAALPPIQ